MTRAGAAGVLMALAGASALAAPALRITVDRDQVDLGRTVTVTAVAKGLPVHSELRPFVNGKRWGAEAYTNAYGRASFALPLPNPGPARIQVDLRPAVAQPNATWIWAAETHDQQDVWLLRTFTLPVAARRAVLWMACDNEFQATLNGHPVGSGADFSHAGKFSGLERRLKVGDNTLAVACRNGTGPAGLLARLEVMTERGVLAVPSGPGWRCWTAKPAGWPDKMNEAGLAATAIAPIGAGPWQSSVQGWPGLDPDAMFPVGTPLPKNTLTSNAVTVNVRKRAPVMKTDPAHLVGMEWEPWFTPLNARWETAQSIPVVGKYDSFNTDVIRQHALWMVRAGVDFLLIDWSNNLWDKGHFAERGPGVNELIRATTITLDTYARMRREGLPTPRVTLLLGLNNGPHTTIEAINEEMRWAYDNYVANPRYRGLWVMHEGKPLIVPFNGAGPDYAKGLPPIDTSLFTVRWMASQFQKDHFEKAGYWSWMDGTVHPLPTMANGKAEALTVTPAFFGDGGWTYPQAMGRLGGTTYVEEFKTAIRWRPRFLLINQWNEFTGQPEGGGYGPEHDQYVDTYSVELSDDIEPVSTALHGYRGSGGWGYYYLNLTRALVSVYHQKTPRDTVIAVSAPAKPLAQGEPCNVTWNTIGRAPVRYSVLLDGKEVARVKGTRLTISTKRLRRGAHRVTVRAEGCVTRFPLRVGREDEPLPEPIPSAAVAAFTVR